MHVACNAWRADRTLGAVSPDNALFILFAAITQNAAPKKTVHLSCHPRYPKITTAAHAPSSLSRICPPDGIVLFRPIDRVLYAPVPQVDRLKREIVPDVVVVVDAEVPCLGLPAVGVSPTSLRLLKLH